jgi:8-oxo-dGTP pyrophosphatase MutT (NUDIX family)
MNMLKQMTIDEKVKLKRGDFNELWENIWGENSVLNKYKTEESVSKEKFQNLFTGILVKDEYYTLNSLIDESNTFQEDKWIEPEWGFPKGRRNFLEKDYDCAIRECCEETGFKSQYLRNTQNILPFEEIFTGSNYKSYKHKYYLMYIDYANSLNIQDFQKTEVSKMEWKSLEEALESIRYYNVEKKRILIKIDKMLKKYKMMRM